MTARIIGRTGKARDVDCGVSDLIRIGSAPDNELQIPSRMVSRRHAQVVRDAGQFFVEDLNSRNGTFLNGQRVKRFPVRHLDVLTLAPDVDLIFLEGAASLPPARPSAVQASVTWSDGPLGGQTEPVPAGGLILGRRPAFAEIAAISRKHAVITIRGSRVTVEDLNSPNGTWVNGTRIQNVTELHDGDLVRLANLMPLRVSITGAPRREPAPVSVEGGTIVVDIPRGDPAIPTLDLPPGQLGAGQTPSEATPAGGPPISRPHSSGDAEPLTERGDATAPDDRTIEVRPDGVVLPHVDSGPPSADSPTIEAPRAPASLPSFGGTTQRDAPTVSVRREAAGVPLFESTSREDTPTVAAPRAPAVIPPMAPLDEPLETVSAAREDAPAVPPQVVAKASEARDAVGATVTSPDAPERTDADATPPRAATPRVSDADSGVSPVIGIRLDGPATFTLNRGVHVVGRHADADIRLDARDVGRRHARLHVDAAGVSVEDLDTANGTFVEDVRVQARHAVPDGSRLRFATMEFSVTYLREGRPRS